MHSSENYYVHIINISFHIDSSMSICNAFWLTRMLNSVGMVSVAVHKERRREWHVLDSRKRVSCPLDLVCKVPCRERERGARKLRKQCGMGKVRRGAGRRIHSIWKRRGEVAFAKWGTQGKAINPTFNLSVATPPPSQTMHCGLRRLCTILS